MALGGLRPALLLLLVLLPTGLALIFIIHSSQEFVAKHVDFPRTRPPPGQQYCNYLMWQRRFLIGPGRRTFTFVHADPSQLSSLCRCGDGLQPSNRPCVSRNPIATTTCCMVAGAGLGCCPFMGQVKRRRIRVACRGGIPVEFLGTV